MSIKHHNIPSPCYVLEQQKLIDNLEVFKKVQAQTGVWALCALKGFSFYHEFPTLNQYIKGATASSLHEVLLASTYFDEVHACCPVLVTMNLMKLLPKYHTLLSIH